MNYKKNIEEKTPPKVTFSFEEKSILNNTRKFVETIYNQQKKTKQITQGSHGMDHTERVTGMSSVLAVLENKPPFLPVLAALLHDVGRAFSSDKRSLNYLHGQLSRKIAQDFIDSLSISIKYKIIVANAIEDHPFLNEKVRKSFVVKILMDADRLDSMGAMAPVKAASYKWNLPLYTGKPKSIKDDEIDSVYGHFGFRIPQWNSMMWTKSGKQIASKRLQFLKKFNDEFVKEITFMQDSYNRLNI